MARVAFEMTRTIDLQHADTAQALPLSCAQEQMWFVQRHTPGTTVYNQYTVLRLTGVLAEDRLENALNQAVFVHQSLRSVFYERAGEPYAAIVPFSPVILVKEDHTRRTDPEASAFVAIRRERERPFDLATGPLFRLSLHRIGAQEHLLALVIHHIVMDAWSVSILLESIRQAYADGLRGVTDPVQAEDEYYQQYARRQKDDAESNRFQADIDYFRGTLAGVEEFDFQWDRAKGAGDDYQGSAVEYRLDAGKWNALKALAGGRRCTPGMLLFAAWQLLLCRYTGRNDQTSGVALSGREDAAMQRTVGLFINTAPLRTILSPESTFAELLQTVRQSFIQTLQRQRLPFGELVKALAPGRSRSSHPVYQVLFNMYNVPTFSPDWEGGLHAANVTPDDGSALLDLALLLREREGGLHLRLKYKTRLLDEDGAQALLTAYGTLLAVLPENLHTDCGRIPLMDEPTLARLLGEWNQTEPAFPHPDLVTHFRRTAAIHAGKTALFDESRGLSFAELDRLSDNLFSDLAENGVEAGAFVGLAMERSLEWYVAMLAIIKAGAAYVPIDLNAPLERTLSMLSDIGAEFVVQAPARKMLFPEHIRVLSAGGMHTVRRSVPAYPAMDAHSAAYVMFTSGSTGTPKGVCVTHGGIMRLVVPSAEVSLDDRQIFIQTSTPCFDASTFEIWGALLCGASLAVPPPVLEGLEQWSDAVAAHGATILFLTTELFHLMVEQKSPLFDHLRQLIIGGDVLSPAHAEAFVKAYPKVRLVHAYGPTEATTFTTYYPITTGTDFSRRVPIGRPLPGTRVYILDDRGNPLPVGARGEIYIAGEALARGYVNGDNEAFGQYELPLRGRERLYRTGDLARWLPDGNIDIIGRRGRMLKMRGFRIEPGEIEHVIRRYSGVKQAAVCPLPAGQGVKLAAFVAPEGLDRAGLRAFLQEYLPSYMVPGSIIEVAAIPLNANGKTDLSALRRLADERTIEQDVAEIGDEGLRKMLAIWRELFGRRHGVHDDFFESGGHSLLSIRLMARLEEAFGVKAPVSLLYEHGTPAALYAYVNKRLAEKNAQTRPQGFEIVTIREGSGGDPLFVVHDLNGKVVWFHRLKTYLSDGRPICGLCRHENGEGSVEVKDIAAGHVENIMAFYPQGKILLLGYSIGGIYGYETASQLEAAGRKVELIIFDIKNEYRQHLFLVRIFGHMLHAVKLPQEERTVYLRQRLRNLKTRVRGLFRKPSFHAESRIEAVPEEVKSAVYNLRQRQKLDSWRRYKFSRFDGRIFLLQTEQPKRAFYYLKDFRFGKLNPASGLVSMELKGTHASCVGKEFAEHNAGVLQESLRLIEQSQNGGAEKAGSAR